MIILGGDLSLTSTGAVVWDGERVVAYCNPRTEPLNGRTRNTFKGTVVQRAEFIGYHLVTLALAFPPDMIVFEDYAHSQRTNQSKLGELGGIVRYVLYLHGFHTVYLASPTGVKKWVTGNGRAGKPDMVAAAQPWLPGLTVDDVADALGVARYGALYEESLRTT